MSKYNCYLCASDEGILLDIFGDAGKTFRDNIETCLSAKIKRNDGRSPKICHKCAYELESCRRFLGNYKGSKNLLRDGASHKRKHCSLCCETGNKVHLLEVNEENSLKNVLRKIAQIFDKDYFKQEIRKLCICLDCRYNVDVLFDLKIIYQETVEKCKDAATAELSTFSKTRTSVVSRKTTYIPLPKLNENTNYDSDASTKSSSSNVTRYSDTIKNMSLKRQRGRPRKNSASGSALQFRSCEECHTQVEYGIDMYRYHRTGLTVCKDCWLTMDPEKMSNGKRKKFKRVASDNSTKLCAVFLKDVLQNPTKYSNIYKVERDKYGNTTFLITDESSENEEKDKTPLRRLRGRSRTSDVSATESTVETPKKASKRTVVDKKNEYEPSKRARIATRKSNDSSETLAKKGKLTTGNDVETDNSTSVKPKRRRSSIESTASTKSLDPPVNAAKKTKLDRSPKTLSTRNTGSDDKSIDTGESSSNDTRSVRTTRGRFKAIVSQIDLTKLPEKIEAKSIRRTRSNSFTGQETMALSNRLEACVEKSPPSSSKTRASPSPEVEKKTPKAHPKSAKSDSELEKSYTCSVCRVGYKNRLIGKAHELTHEKQPEIKLRRVIVAPETSIASSSASMFTIQEEKEEKQAEQIRKSLDESNVASNDETMEGESFGLAVTETSDGEIEDSIETNEESDKVQRSEKTSNKKIHFEENKEKMKNQETTDTPREEPEMLEKVETIAENRDDESNHNDDAAIEKQLVDKSTENEAEPECENKENGEKENKKDNIEECSNITEPLEPEKENEKKGKLIGEDATPGEKSDEKMTNDVDSSEISQRNEQESKQNGVVDEEEPNGKTEVVSTVAETVVDDTTNDIAVDISAPKIMEKTDVVESDSTTKDTNEVEAKAEIRKEDKVCMDPVSTKEDEGDAEDKEATIDEEATKDEETRHDEELKKTEEAKKDEEEKKEEESKKDEEGRKEEEKRENTEDKDEEKHHEKDEDADEEENEEETKREEELGRKSNLMIDDIQLEKSNEDSESLNVASEVVRRVFDLASAEVKKRLENKDPNDDKMATPETLENISLEIQNSADISSKELVTPATTNEKS